MILNITKTFPSFSLSVVRHIVVCCVIIMSSMFPSIYHCMLYTLVAWGSYVGVAFTLILRFVISLRGIYCSSLIYWPSFLEHENNLWIWGTKVVIWAIIMFQYCTMNIRYCWSYHTYIIELWGLDIDVAHRGCYSYILHNKGHVGIS